MTTTEGPRRFKTVEEMTGRVIDFNKPEPEEPKRFKAIPFGSIEPNLDEDWLIDDLAPRQGVMFPYGNPEAGKTFLVLDAALHVAAGRPYAGKSVQQGAVFYVAAEGGLGFRKRVAAARKAKNFPPNIPFGLITDRPDLGSKTGDADTIISALREQLPAFGGGAVAMVVLDTLNKVANGAEENSATEMGVLINNVEKLSNELSCLVVVIHHDGKDGDRGMRGSMALRGGCDAIWKIDCKGDQRSVTIERMKDGESGLTWDFELVPVELGTNRRGKVITSCFVEIKGRPEHAGTSVGSQRKRPKGQAAEMLKAVSLAIDASGFVPPASNHIPAGVCCVTRSTLKEYAEKLGFMEGKNGETKRTTLNRHIRVMAGDGYLGQWGEYVWIP